MDMTKFSPRTADDIEGDIGGCTLDALRDDDRYFATPPDAYDIQWFVSKERSEIDDEDPRYALAVHNGQTYLLDLDRYNELLDAETESGQPDDDIDHCWKKV